MKYSAPPLKAVFSIKVLFNRLRFKLNRLSKHLFQIWFNYTINFQKEYLLIIILTI